MFNPIQPKEITIKTQAGDERTYIISKMPAIPAREIISQYPITGMPKIGDYKANETIMLKLMSYVAVQTATGQQELSTQALVNNHVPDWETLGRLEMAMMEYNCSFFRNGVASTFFEAIAQKLPEQITRILTALSAQSSQTEKQPSTNSEQSTA